MRTLSCKVSCRREGETWEVLLGGRSVQSRLLQDAEENADERTFANEHRAQVAYESEIAAVVERGYRLAEVVEEAVVGDARVKLSADEVAIRKGGDRGSVCSHLIGRILRAPLGKGIRKVALVLGQDLEGDDDHAIVNAIAAARPPLLEELVIECEQPWRLDLAPLWAGAPSLTRLSVTGRATAYGPAESTLSLGSIAAPSLRRLELGQFRFRRQHLSSFAEARCPALERLAIGFGAHNQANEDGTGLEIARLLLSTKMAKQLALTGCGFADELCQGIERAAVLPQLETLDLSDGAMTSVGAEALIQAAPALRHLRVLDLRGNSLDDDAQRRITDALPNANVGEQR